MKYEPLPLEYIRRLDQLNHDITKPEYRPKRISPAMRRDYETIGRAIKRIFAEDDKARRDVR